MIASILDAVVRSFPVAIPIGLGLTGATITVHALATRAGARGGAAGLPQLRIGWIARTTRWALLGCTAVLAITAFGSVLTVGSMHGKALLAHVLAGGALTVVLALFAMAWFRAGRRGGRLAGFALGGTLVLGLTAAATMLASTFPLFGTAGLERLLDLHRWSGLGLCMSAALHAYLARAPRRAGPRA